MHRGAKNGGPSGDLDMITLTPLTISQHLNEGGALQIRLLF